MVTVETRIDLARPALEARRERGSGRKGGAEGERGGSSQPAGLRTGHGAIKRDRLASRLEPGRNEPPRRGVSHDRRGEIGRRQGHVRKMVDQPGAIVGMLGQVVHTRRPAPVPVEDGNLIATRGVGMPAEEMVVKLADLPGLVLMADVVKLHLRPGGRQKCQDQQADREGPGSVLSLEPMPHPNRPASLPIGRSRFADLTSVAPSRRM